MTITKEQQKLLLAVLIGTIILVNGYRFLAEDKPKVAPLVYERGATASSPVRHGLQSITGGADPLAILLDQRKQRYPGVSRDIFRMENPRKAKPKPAPVVVVTAPPAPAGPEKTPEEIAADLARADLLKFKYLGYVVEKDMTLFLSKDGELFVVKIGDKVLAKYTVREANKDFAVILDTATRVEGRVPLSGGEIQLQQQPQTQQQAPYPKQPQQQQAAYPAPQRALQPAPPAQSQQNEPAALDPRMQQLQRKRQRGLNLGPGSE